MDEPRFDPLDYISVFNRRKWFFIVPVALSIVVGMALVYTLPRTYQATTTIAVSAARVAPIAGAVEMDKQERMRAVSQQLLSRPVLERTARLERLDQNASIDAASRASLTAGKRVSSRAWNSRPLSSSRGADGTASGRRSG